MKQKKILLSFDIEEFDTPLEYGRSISLQEQLNYSKVGMENLLNLLNKHNIRSTLFVTANFAKNFPLLIYNASKIHEIASHGYFHSSFNNEDLLSSRLELERISNKKVYGFRMARMMPVDDLAIKKAGYIYNASIHPTFIPGRYNNLRKPRVPFVTKENLVQIPASVTPSLRFPVFWLSFKNFPLFIIKNATKSILSKDGFANFYFHPWEFTNISDKEKLNLPFYIANFSGQKMLHKLEEFILWCRRNNYAFATYKEFGFDCLNNHR